jgi:hypothetical protein
MSNTNYYSEYIRSKFEYLCLKFNNQYNQHYQLLQLGGYSENSPTHIAAAAISVINCTYFGTNQKSVDCPTIDPNTEQISKINAELAKLTESVKDRGKKMELTRQLESLQPRKSQIKSEIKSIDVSNRICDNVLATVASVYLSILFNMGSSTNSESTTDSFTLALNDFINKKIRNCSKQQRTPEKIKEIIKYYLNVINKINYYLENIGKPNGVSYIDMFTNAEYGKSDKKVIEKLKEKGLEIAAIDEENFRMINDFIGSNLEYVKKISVHDVLAKLKVNSTTLDNNLLEELKTNYPNVNSQIDVNDWIVYGVYTYERQSNKTTVSNPITQSVRISRKL